MTNEMNATTVQVGSRWNDGWNEFEIVEVGTEGARAQFDNGSSYSLAWTYLAGCRRIEAS